MDEHTGISNRETPDEEAQEREEHPPKNRKEPAEPLSDLSGHQTAHKAGSRSIAQKEDNTRYPDRSMPATHKVGGAFGKEPDEQVEE